MAAGNHEGLHQEVPLASSANIVFVTLTFAPAGAPKKYPSPFRNDMNALNNKLEASFPNSTCTGFQYTINAGQEDFWGRLESSAWMLPDQIKNKATASPKSSMVILCHGLGGLMALRHMNDVEILQNTAAFVFFGTPTNISHNRFFKAVSRCALVEYGEQVKTIPMDKCESIVREFKDKHKAIISVYESKKCSHTKSIWPKKSIVEHDLASVPQQLSQKTQSIPSGTEHCEMLSEMNLNTLIHAIQKAVTEHLRGPLQNDMQNEQQDIPTGQAQVSAGKVLGGPPDLFPIRSRLPPLPADPFVRLITFPRNPDFSGRAAIIEKIKKHLDRKNGSLCGQRSFALYGLPGMGKTQIARRLVEEVYHIFTYILWVDATLDTSILIAYATFAKKLRLVSDQVDISTAASALMDWFEQCDVPFLVVLDNANDFEMVRNHWPGGDMASVLVTTINSELVFSSAHISGAEVDKLDEEDAIQMIMKQVNDDGKADDDESNWEEARIIVNNVHGMALAVQLAILLINTSKDKLGNFNKQYPNDTRLYAPLKTHRTVSVFDRYGKTVQSAFSQLLEKLDPEPRNLMNVLSLLHSSQIPEALFEPKNVDDTQNKLPFIRNYDQYKYKFISNLLKRGDGDNSKTFELHGLMSQSIREQMSATDQQHAFSVATSLLCHVLETPQDFNENSEAMYREIFSSYHMHISAIKSYHEKTWQNGDNKDKVPPSYIRLLGLSAWFWYTRGFFSVALGLIDEAEMLLDDIAKCRKHYCPATQDDEAPGLRIKLAHTHACIANGMGDFRLALRMFNKENTLVESARGLGITKLYGTRQRSAIYGGLANAHQGLGNHTEAIPLYEKSIGLCPKEKQNAYPYVVNICRSFLALGRHEEAGIRLEALVEDRQQKYGAGDFRDYLAGHQLFVLGNVRIKQNRLEEAFNLHRGALANTRATKGELHRKTGDAWHKIGWHHVRRGEWAEANEAYSQALKIFRSATIQGNSIFPNAEIAWTSFHLSGVLTKMALPDEAAKAMGEAQRLGLIVRASIRKRDSETDGVHSKEVVLGTVLTEKDFEKLVSPWAL